MGSQSIQLFQHQIKTIRLVEIKLLRIHGYKGIVRRERDTIIHFPADTKTHRKGESWHDRKKSMMNRGFKILISDECAREHQP